MKNYIIERIEKYATEEGKVAITYLGQNITYYQLNVMSNYVAHRINKFLGESKNSPILIYQNRGIEFIIFMIAIMKTGCFYVPLENSMPLERVKYILNDLQAKCIISTQIIEGVDKSNQINISIDDMKSECDKFSYYNEIMDDDLVYVMYTSGTSGKPKGVKIKYTNLFNLINSFWNIVYHQFESSVNIGVLASFSFDASVKQIFCALYYGHNLIISEENVKFFGRRIHSFHNKYNITLCDCTPSHLKLMYRQTAKENTKIKYMVVGGENLCWDILTEFSNVVEEMPVIINVYGPTECCVDVSYNYITSIKSDADGYVPIGKPLDNTRLYIQDENGNNIDQPNVFGELIVEGKQIGAGYVNYRNTSFSNTGKSLGFDTYRTGDLAMFNEDKDIIILSRLDRQVKVNGYRIELDEISQCIESITKYGCDTILIENDEIKKLVSFIEGPFDESLVKMELLRRLPNYMVPKVYIQVEYIPLTKNGKLDTRELERIYYSDCEEMKR